MKRSPSMKLFCSIALAFVIVIVAGYGNANAADIAVQLAEQYLKKIPVGQIDTKMSMEEAIKVQEQFVAILSRELGEPVGYKAALTNPNVQKLFGVSHPVRGTLLQKMILKSGSAIPADFGTRPMSEGDLVVRVGDDGINNAKTHEATLQYIDAVIPFIELPDLVYGKDVKLNGPALVAINAGARYGVVGEPIAVKATPEWRNRLKTFTLQIFDEKGLLVTEGKGSSLLDDPLHVILWIKDSLAAEGKKLKKGDLLSLGTITKMIPVKSGSIIRAKYIGLDPDVPIEISVSFK